MRGRLALVLALLAAQPAHAQPPGWQRLPLEPALDEEVAEDTELGPVVTIEEITIRGNTATQPDIIRRALPIAPGDVLRQSDKRLRDARFKVLGLGYFADVQVSMRKGTRRGRMIIDVVVVERGTFVLNKLWFGHTDFAPYWLGIDVGDRNLAGLGIAADIAAIYAAPSELDGSRAQWAGEFRLAADSLRGTRWGAMGSLTLAHGSDFYQIDENGDTTPDERAFAYRRFGSRFGATYDVTTLSRVSVLARVEQISHDIRSPILARRLWLEEGESRVITLGVGFDRDTRSDPILPHHGSRISAGVEVGATGYGSDYDFLTGFARYERWWPLRDRRHTIGFRLAGGIVVGDAPRFDYIYVGDINRMLTPRALGLVLSNAEPLHLLNTRKNKPAIGDLGGIATIEYAAQLFRGSGKRRVYGGDVFAGFGMWGLTPTDELFPPAESGWRAAPIDLYVDAGIRIDTELGIFELTIANALGRLR
jgi:outer membrane protein assembly factor BamA